MAALSKCVASEDSPRPSTKKITRLTLDRPLPCPLHMAARPFDEVFGNVAVRLSVDATSGYFREY